MYDDEPSPPQPMWPVIIGLVIIGLICLLTVASAKTTGTKYLGPDENDYYESIMMPDNPKASCCGAADVYWADEQEVGPNGEIIAIVTDARPDTRTLPDGRQIDRYHVPVGTKIPIPASKIRKVPIPNPTGHTIIWLGVGSVVYCYEPQPLL
jgi:hypothetical protein